MGNHKEIEKKKKEGGWGVSKTNGLNQGGTPLFVGCHLIGR